MLHATNYIGEVFLLFFLMKQDFADMFSPHFFLLDIPSVKVKEYLHIEEMEVLYV